VLRIEHEVPMDTIDAVFGLLGSVDEVEREGA